jgi:hypothetical protein
MIWEDETLGGSQSLLAEAVQLKAAERYVLGELSADLRAQYEEHYFGCMECAEELKLAAAFVENTRAVLESESEPVTAASREPAVVAHTPSSSGWLAGLLRPSIAVPVFALLLLFAGYQNLIVIPHLKSAAPSGSPQTLPSYSLLTAGSRGGKPLRITVPANKPFSLYIDIPPERQFPQYVCEVENASGATQPEGFSYIHFVAHGTASRTSPLDSAVILSKRGDNYKLYARNIIQHPLHADLVTISACHGEGVRTYSGEGLVGLSWAFLRAGAHGVIAALWEVNDNSTPQLMDHLYAEISKGVPPATALHDAKLVLLHSGTVYRRPFYWASFQFYRGA